MDENVLNNIRDALQEKANDMAGLLAQIAGENPGPAISIQAYEASRRLEDFMSRVGNCALLQLERTEGAVTARAEEALAKGEVVTGSPEQPELKVMNEPLSGPDIRVVPEPAGQ